MKNLNELLKRRRIDFKALTKYGFKKEKEKYLYEQNIVNDDFRVVIEISEEEKTAQVIENAINEEYILVDVENAVGEFVGKVRSEYENVINDFLEKCSEREIYKNKQAKKVFDFLKEKYDAKFESPWDKYDEFIIVRNEETQKWYALFMIIPENKLYGENGKEIEVLNLHTKPEVNELLVDNETIFPGYHMNKKSWITIVLDGRLEDEEVFELINNSYLLSIGEKKVDKLAIKVYEYLRKIPKGKVVTYGQVAEYLGNKGLSRIVGTILHNNPDGEKNPCYKVLNSKGELAESFVFGGANVQKERLEKDGIEVKNNKVDLKKYKWKEE